jgi:hypothetical protein
VGGSCTAAQPYLTEILHNNNYNGVCLRTSARVEYGFYVAWFAMMGQIFMGIVMIRANQIVLRDREDQLEARPHAMWSWIEYFVLRFMFVHGAEHHRPFLNPTSTIIDKAFFIVLSWFENPTQTTKDVTKEAAVMAKAKSKTCCSALCCCFRGIDTVSLEVPVGHAAPSKWNAPQSVANPHHHVASGAGRWNAAPTVPAEAKSAKMSAQTQPISPSSKWNTPPTTQASSASSKWNVPQPKPAARQSDAPPQRGQQGSTASFKTPSSRVGSSRIMKAMRPAPTPSTQLQAAAAPGGLAPPPGLNKNVVVSQSGSESENPIFKREKAFSVDV